MPDDLSDKSDDCFGLSGLPEPPKASAAPSLKGLNSDLDLFGLGFDEAPPKSKDSSEEGLHTSPSVNHSHTLTNPSIHHTHIQSFSLTVDPFRRYSVGGLYEKAADFDRCFLFLS